MGKAVVVLNSSEGVKGTVHFTQEGDVTWIKKKTRPSVYNITDTEEAEKILSSNDKLVLAYLNSLTGGSISQLWIDAGDENGLNTIEVGWQVNPSTGSSRPRIFIYLTIDSYKTTCCC